MLLRIVDKELEKEIIAVHAISAHMNSRNVDIASHSTHETDAYKHISARGVLCTALACLQVIVQDEAALVDLMAFRRACPWLRRGIVVEVGSSTWTI